MDINFTDIARLAKSMADGDSIIVKSDNTLEVISGELDGHLVSVLPNGSHILTNDECFAALARSVGEEFANTLREGMLQVPISLGAREIRNIADKSAVAIETQSHLRQLEAGLLSKGSAALDPAEISATISSIRGKAELTGIITEKPFPDVFKSIDKAMDALVKARAKLTNINCAKLGAAKVAERLAALAAAQDDLATALTEFTNQLRSRLSDEGIAANDLYQSLELLDDLSELAARDTAKAEELAGTLRQLARKAPLPADLAQSVARLLEFRNAVTGEVLVAARNQIETFSETAKHLFASLASLDNAAVEESLADDEHPAPTTTERLAALEVACADTRNQLALLENTPGIDAKALKDFKAKFRQIEQRVQTLRNGFVEKFAGDSLKGLMSMLSTGITNASDNRFLAAYPELGVIKDILLSYQDTIKMDMLQLDPTKTLSEVLRDQNSKLRKDLIKIGENVRRLAKITTFSNKGDRVDRIDLLRLCGLQRMESRIYALLNGLDDTCITSPVSAINSQLLGEVVRGEIDIVNYMELKQSDLPLEMLRTDLVSRSVSSEPNRQDSGGINTVEFVPMTNTRQQSVTTYVLKPHEKTEQSAARSTIASLFSRHSHARNIAKLNFASKLAAKLIGCGSQITSNGIVRHQNQFMLVQEKANGALADNVARNNDKAMTIRNSATSSVKAKSIQSGLKSLPPATRARAEISLQLEFAKLEWADWLSGQLDRHLANLFVNVNVETTLDGKTHVSAEVKGIDNDASFPERRPQLRMFKMSNEHGAMVDVDIDDPDSMYDIAHTGLRSARRPTFLPQSVKDQIENLTIDEFRAQMGPYLSVEALDSAVSRLQEMKDAIANGEYNGRIIDDTHSVGEMTDDDAIHLAEQMNTRARADFVACKRAFGSDIAEHVAGGFFGGVFFS